MEKIQRWFELNELAQHYVNSLDNDRLEEWPGYFTEDGQYEIIPRENFDQGLPAPIMLCRNQRMMRDRVLSLRHANIYEKHAYRHMTSGLTISPNEDGSFSCESSYVVILTGQAGDSTVYQAGRYLDVVVRQYGAWRYRSKRVVYDTSRVATLLATPI